MKLTIKCPNCGHRFRTVVGVVLLAEWQTSYYLNWDWFRTPGPVPEGLKKAKAKGWFVCYCCKKCNERYPKEKETSG